MILDNKKVYILMHMERKVMMFTFLGDVKIISKKFMPYGLYVEENDDVESKTNNALNIINFLARRVITIDRKYSKLIYNYLNIPQNNDDRTKAMFAITYHALCLTDVYWVKEKNEKVTFKNINLYDNSLSNAYVDIFLRGKRPTVNKDNIDSRDISTSGQCAKAWIRESDGKFYLCKDGNINDVKNELMASKIIEHFKIDAVRYKRAYYDKKLVSKCEIITSKKYSLIIKMDLEIYCINHNIDLYEYIKKLDSYNYYMMNIIDYLIGNDDRHPNNWGALIDNKTNKIIKLYSLMDFNKTFKNYNNLDGGMSLTTKERITKKEAAKEAVKIVGLNILKPVRKDVFDNNNARWRMFNKRLKLLKNSV